AVIKEVQFRPHEISLDQPDRDLAAEGLYVDSAADRECEAGVGDRRGDRVVLQLEARHPEQGVGERLKHLVPSKRELRAEQEQGLSQINAWGDIDELIAEMAADVGFNRERFFEDGYGARYVIAVQISILAIHPTVFEAHI